MKNFMSYLILTVCILATSVCAIAQETQKVETKKFQSSDFPIEREIFIATPPYYDDKNQTDVDVVYVFDSQWRSHFALAYGMLAETLYPDDNQPPFIVVGVTSPSSEEYCRTNDFLPVPTSVKYESPYYGNYENFKKFLRDDVFPYINSNYRTSGHTLAIGYSLSASFILNALASEEMFDDYIAISPNFMEDNNKFADNFLSYNFNNRKPRFLFLSMANESEENGFGEGWRPVWNFVKSKVESTSYPEHIKMMIKEYPHHSHMSYYAECLMDVLPLYKMYRQTTHFSDSALHPVHIELECPWAEDSVFITGNQDALANWNPQGVKMNKIDDKTFSIDLNLMLPAEFKFTQGSWENQINPENAYFGNLRIFSPEKTNKHYTAN